MTGKEGRDMESIVVSIVTGVCSIIGVILAASASSSKLQKQLEISQAVMNTKIEALTQEVRAHNEFAKRMPVVEEQIKVANHRIEDLERENHEHH
jgi:TolA-binding protein